MRIPTKFLLSPDFSSGSDWVTYTLIYMIVMPMSKINNPRLSQARDLVFLKFFYYISFPLQGKLILKQIYFNLIFSLYNIPVSHSLYIIVSFKVVMIVLSLDLYFKLSL